MARRNTGRMRTSRRREFISYGRSNTHLPLAARRAEKFLGKRRGSRKRMIL